MKPLEDTLRARLVDIVRSCQSTVEQNFRVARASRTGSGYFPPPAPQNSAPLQQGDGTLVQQDQISSFVSNNPVTDFFHEPPHVAAGASDPFVDLSQATNSQGRLQPHFVDSTYGSLPESCECVCHLYSTDDCAVCVRKHTDSGAFRFEDWMNPP